MACAICQTRRPRRFCPGVQGEICSVCCGTEREVTVSCPLECEYLQEGRKRDKRPPLDEGTEIPNLDLRVNEAWLHDHERLLAFMAGSLLRPALEIPGVVDHDLREALEALIRTYRTLQSGVYYETRPENPLAAGTCDMMKKAIAEYRREETQRLGITKTRDGEVLRLLVFLQHFELDSNNGRRLGRAFVDALRALYAAYPGAELPPESSLILP
jgi:hypothetical protein